MADMTAARAAKDAAHLAQLVRTHDGTVLTRGELILRRVNLGWSLDSRHVPDMPKRASAARTLSAMERKRGGFGIPWGNDKHPDTIRAHELRAEANEATTVEWSLCEPFDCLGRRLVLTATERRYAESILKARTR